jgi:hypothetical protein
MEKVFRKKAEEERKLKNKKDLEDKDGDHIPDRIDSTYSPDGYRTQTDIDYNADNDYIKALVTAEEYEKLEENGFVYQKAKSYTDGDKIPIRFKKTEKEILIKILHSSNTKNSKLHR